MLIRGPTRIYRSIIATPKSTIYPNIISAGSINYWKINHTKYVPVRLINLQKDTKYPNIFTSQFSI